MTVAVKEERDVIGLFAAVAWLIVPFAWSIAQVLDRTRPWEGAPLAWFITGWLSLIAAGVLTSTMAFRNREQTNRPGLTKAGMAVMILGCAATVVVSWAVPVWTTLFGVGMLLIAAGGSARAATRLIGWTFLAGTGSFMMLTALEVGRPDIHGDYPVAWVTATLVATVGAALGMLAWGVLAESKPAPDRQPVR